MSTDHQHCVDEILRRLMYIKKLTTFQEVADFLGVSNKTLSAWKQRNSKVAVQKISTKCSDIDLNWLVNGEWERPRWEAEKQTSANRYAISEESGPTIIDEVLLEAAIAFVETYEQLLDEGRHSPSRKAETVMKMCRKWGSDGTYVKGDTVYDILRKVGIKDAYDNLEDQYKRKKCPADY